MQIINNGLGLSLSNFPTSVKSVYFYAAHCFGLCDWTDSNAFKISVIHCATQPFNTALIKPIFQYFIQK